MLAVSLTDGYLHQFVVREMTATKRIKCYALDIPDLKVGWSANLLAIAYD